MLCFRIPVFELFEELLMVASVEAPLTFFQKPIKIFRFDAIEFS